MNLKTRIWPAEWGRQSAVLFCFPRKESDWTATMEQVVPCFVACVKTVCKYQKAIVVCENENDIENYFLDIPKTQLTIIECSSNDTWARDFGPITVFEKEQSVFLDFTFNGWGNKFPADLDNQISKTLFHQGVFGKGKMKSINFVLEGGSIETNGKGTILTTSNCLLSKERNPHFDRVAIEELLEIHLGADHFLWLEHGKLEGDDTDSHIDTLARFVNETSIVYVKCDQTDDPHFEELERMEKELQTFKDKNGQPYHLIPLPWPDACFAEDGHRLPATYANFLFINDAVLLPIYGVKQDADAMAVFEKIFPDRTVIPINCRPLIEQHGSLHCITMQIPALNEKPKLLR